MPAPSELLIATRNKGKAIEIQSALSDLPLRLRSLNEFLHLPSIEESGSTYRENCVIKARKYANRTGIWALADDSGLEVAALGGAPGLHSARFASEGATDSERATLLLEAMSAAQCANRSARFICVLALAGPGKAPVNVVEGRCEGRIANQSKGHNGFGYDPIFIPEGYDLTFAQLSPQIKNAISHRAAALKAIHELLTNWAEA